MTGDHTVERDFDELSQHDLKSGELKYGVPAALVVLLLVFAAIVAGLVPLLLAVVSIVVGFGLVALLSQPFELSVFILNMLTGMGLALCIDYSLFVISRYREERGQGRDPSEAIGAAGAVSIMRSLAAGAIVVGIVSIAVALTLLPALLGLLRDRVNAGRIPLIGASLDWRNPEGRFWRAVIDRVFRRPVLSLALAAAVLVGAATPVFGMQIGQMGVSTMPDRFVAKRGFLALQRDFPKATTDPVRIVVDQVTGAEARARFASCRGRTCVRPALRRAAGAAGRRRRPHHCTGRRRRRQQRRRRRRARAARASRRAGVRWHRSGAVPGRHLGRGRRVLRRRHRPRRPTSSPSSSASPLCC
jgi:RND superfamily putative drug exporter